MEVLPNAATKRGGCMLQRKLIYLLILITIISSWLVGFYFGRKSETIKKLNYNFSVSHAETLIDSLEFINNSQNEQLNVHLTRALDNNLFPIFYELSKEDNNLSKAEKSRVKKLIYKIDTILSREDVDYLLPIATDERSKNEYYSYIEKGLAEIRSFNIK